MTEPDDAVTLAEAKLEVEHVAGRLRKRSKHERRLIVAVAIFACVSTWAIVLNHQLGQKLERTITRNHAARVADQARMDAEIRSLACILVSQTPNDPKKPLIKQFRDYYRCPPYSAAGAASPIPKQPTPATTTRTVSVPVTVPVPTTIIVPGPTRVRVLTRTKTLPAPRPTVCAGRICVTLPLK